MANERPWYVQDLHFLEDLTPAENAMIRKMGTIRKFKKGQFVFHVNDSCEHVYVLQKGIAKASLVSPEGKEIITALRKPGDIIGLTAIFGCKRRLS